MRFKFAVTCALVLCLALTVGMAHAAITNFVANPGFENGEGTTAPPWYFNQAWGSGTAQAVLGTTENPAHAGLRMWKHNPDGSATGWQCPEQVVYFPSGSSYIASAWIRVPDASPEAPARVNLRLWFGNASNNYISGFYGAEKIITDSNWTLIEDGTNGVGLTPDPSCDQVIFRIYGFDMGQRVMYVDDVSLLGYTYDVTGRVVDQYGNPVPGATVNMYATGASVPKTGTTDELGNYRINVGPNTYSISASKPNYYDSLPQTVTVVDADVAVTPDLVIEKLPTNFISGKVLEDGVGVPGVDVSFSYYGAAELFGPQSVNVVSGPDGSYTAEIITGSMVTGGIRKFGYRAVNAAELVDIYVDADLALDIMIENEGPLVKVQASSLTAGDSVASWVNEGSVGGTFDAQGTAPVVEAVTGYKAIKFNRTGWYKLFVDDPLNPGTKVQYNSYPDNMEIIGKDGGAPVYTMSAWLFSWQIAGNGRDCAYLSFAPFTHAANFYYGDWGWAHDAFEAYTGVGSDNGNRWTGGQLQNVIITCDGINEKLYVDGVLLQTQSVTPAAGQTGNFVNPANNYPVHLGSTAWNDTADPGDYFNGYMAKLEIYRTPASESDVAALYAAVPVREPVAEVTGKVVTSDGSSPAGFAVRILDDMGVAAGNTTTDDAGVYSFTVVPGKVYTVSAKKSGFTTSPSSQSVNAELAGNVYPVGDFVASAASISGVVKDAVTGLPIYNAVVQIEGRGGAAVVTDATGAYSFAAAGGFGGVELFADALGYEAQNLLVTGSGALQKTILLNPVAETGVGVNGGFEDVVNNQPTGWGEVWTAGGLQFSSSTDAFTGNYSAWYTGTASYSALAQYVAIEPGYVYTSYFKAKADAGVNQWFPMISFRSDTDGEMKGWISGEPGKDGWVHTPPYDWYQYLLFHTYSGDATQPFVRIAPPTGAVNIAVSFCFADLPPAGLGCYVDDVVIDKVPADMPLTVVAPDGGAPVYGANNKSILTDEKLVGKTVRAWGSIININGTVSCVISDGYSAGVTVNLSGVTLPVDFELARTAVVTGVVNADKSIQASAISVL